MNCIFKTLAFHLVPEFFRTVIMLQLDDVFHAHIGGADTFARALLTADKIITSSPYEKLRKARYNSFDSGNGKAFEEGKLSLSDLYNIAHENGELPLISGKQELFENIVNQLKKLLFILKVKQDNQKNNKNRSDYPRVYGAHF